MIPAYSWYGAVAVALFTGRAAWCGRGQERHLPRQSGCRGVVNQTEVAVSRVRILWGGIRRVAGRVVCGVSIYRSMLSRNVCRTSRCGRKVASGGR